MKVPGFQLAAVNGGIEGTKFHGQVTHLSSAISTMDPALRAAQSGARGGVWVADRQLAGRGRGTNQWHSAAGEGLYMTALTAPEIPALSALRLSFRVAIAVQAAIAEITGLAVREQIDIRWPNDLMVTRANAPARKCAGILIDMASNPAQGQLPATLRYALIGIGVNLNQLRFPAELDGVATSLRRELPGKPLLRREPLMAAILRRLDVILRELVANPEQTLRDPGAYSSWVTGKRVRVEPRAGERQMMYTGTTAGLDERGFLRVAADEGEMRTVLTGGLREPIQS